MFGNTQLHTECICRICHCWYTGISLAEERYLCLLLFVNFLVRTFKCQSLEGPQKYWFLLRIYCIILFKKHYGQVQVFYCPCPLHSMCITSKLNKDVWCCESSPFYLLHARTFHSKLTITKLSPCFSIRKEWVEGERWNESGLEWKLHNGFLSLKTEQHGVYRWWESSNKYSHLQ